MRLNKLRVNNKPLTTLQLNIHMFSFIVVAVLCQVSKSYVVTYPMPSHDYTYTKTLTQSLTGVEYDDNSVQI
jgi:hypothetical protein